MYIQHTSCGRSDCLRIIATHIMLDNAEAISQEIMQHIRHSQGLIILDLQDVLSMDSSGLSLLVLLLRELRTRFPRGKIVLSGTTEHICQLIKLTCLNQIFRCFPDVLSARNYLQNFSPTSTLPI